MLVFNHMQAVLPGLVFALQVLPILAADRVFDFKDAAPGQAPAEFRSTAASGAAPGDWKVLQDDVPVPGSLTATSPAPSVVRQAVLAHGSGQAEPARFPLLIFDRETFGDFKFTARFKITGASDQVAGLVFRYQNESNFFAVGAALPSGLLRCHKVLNGEWKPPFSEKLEISADAWHEMSVECEGARMVCSLDGQPLIKLIDAPAAPTGKIGFWTRSDSAASFTGARISYRVQVQETLARRLVQDGMKKYSELLGLKIYAVLPGGTEPVIIASSDDTELGKAGGRTEREVISRAQVYYGKEGKVAEVTLPLCDRNGEPVAAVCVVLKAGPGQTQDNAVLRARPVAKAMQARVQTLDELLH
jgi:hypothetical protein